MTSNDTTVQGEKDEDEEDEDEDDEDGAAKPTAAVTEEVR
jgi:hypothetical protein